jgi:hypothetical protein
MAQALLIGQIGFASIGFLARTAIDRNGTPMAHTIEQPCGLAAGRDIRTIRRIKKWLGRAKSQIEVAAATLTMEVLY